MKKALMALIAGCALVAGAAAPVLCAEIVGTVHDANGNAISGVTVSTSTQDGQTIGSSVTDGQGDYTIDGVSSGLYYITLAPPAGGNLSGQSVASYVGGTGLTVNWGVAAGRAPVASAMPGVESSSAATSSAALFASNDYGDGDQWGRCMKPYPSSSRDYDYGFKKCCKRWYWDYHCRPKPSKKRPCD